MVKIRVHTRIKFVGHVRSMGPHSSSSSRSSSIVAATGKSFMTSSVVHIRVNARIHLVRYIRGVRAGGGGPDTGVCSAAHSAVVADGGVSIGINARVDFVGHVRLVRTCSSADLPGGVTKAIVAWRVEVGGTVV